MKIFKIQQVVFEYPRHSDDLDFEPEDASKIDAGEGVFKRNEIRNTKQITDIAINDGTVVGATQSEWNRWGKYMAFEFDVAVDEKYRGMIVGPRLIQRAIDIYNQEKHTYLESGEKTIMYLNVINAKLADWMIKHHGFEVLRTSMISTILVKE